MTAVGLLCRQYLGVDPSDASVLEAKRSLMEALPDPKETNCYYWYYATLAMHNFIDSDWDTWNRTMRRTLIQSQAREGCTTGSWDPEKPNSDSWGIMGGRLMTTSFNALTLEVPYRYSALFRTDPISRQKGNMGFPEADRRRIGRARSGRRRNTYGISVVGQVGNLPVQPKTGIQRQVGNLPHGTLISVRALAFRGAAASGWGGGGGPWAVSFGGGGSGGNCLAISGGIVPPDFLSSLAASQSLGVSVNALRNSPLADSGWPVIKYCNPSRNRTSAASGFWRVNFSSARAESCRAPPCRMPCIASASRELGRVRQPHGPPSPPRGIRAWQTCPASASCGPWDCVARRRRRGPPDAWRSENHLLQRPPGRPDSSPTVAGRQPAEPSHRAARLGVGRHCRRRPGTVWILGRRNGGGYDAV